MKRTSGQPHQILHKLQNLPFTAFPTGAHLMEQNNVRKREKMGKVSLDDDVLRFDLRSQSSQYWRSSGGDIMNVLRMRMMRIPPRVSSAPQ
ncbi:hypothetical protein GDO81_000218 [Engystomops pustulosus]|uniref:Uncharacterized protein n=1 Tax=Engystomops pustulosus TaxID=76066 RepID=A0AAV7D2H5_ENGPU|nr:hypothetical protein GDO81_000218 [Engystomops pustulosus]